MINVMCACTPTGLGPDPGSWHQLHTRPCLPNASPLLSSAEKAWEKEGEEEGEQDLNDVRADALRDGALQGLLEFLAYEPFYDSRSWSSLVLRRGEAGPERLAPLCSLLRGVMLRRTKDSVGAPRQALHLHAHARRPSCFAGVQATCKRPGISKHPAATSRVNAQDAFTLLCQHSAVAAPSTQVPSGSRLQPRRHTGIRRQP